MKVKASVLWKVPVYCLISSWISFYITVYLGGFFFLVKKEGLDGITEVSIDPVRSAVFQAVLFIIILLLGGLWLRKSMTKREIAVSSSIITVFYLAVVLVQLIVPNIPVSFGVIMAYFQNWTGEVASLLCGLTNHPPLSALLSCFAPLLFIPFGKTQTE